MTSGEIEVEGGRLWYQEAGEGPAVLLLHAGGADSRMWDEHWEPLAERFRVIRFDLPGAGRSPLPEQPVSTTEHLKQLLDALGAEQAAVVGVSAGGGIAIDFVIERPERTWALVAVACGPRGITDIPPDPRGLQVWKLATAGDWECAAELFLQLWAPLQTSVEADGSIRRMVKDNIGMLALLSRGLIRFPEWSAVDRVGEITVPTLVIWGDQDTRGIQQAAERLAGSIPGARKVVLPGVDHFVPMRAPEAFERELTGFLKQVRTHIR